jgi:hypothetical protein
VLTRRKTKAISITNIIDSTNYKASTNYSSTSLGSSNYLELIKRNLKAYSNNLKVSTRATTRDLDI